jgi:hypothetical protein
MVAISRRTPRPSLFALAAAVDVDYRSAEGASRPTAVGVLGFHPQVIDRVALLLTQPSGDRNQEQPEALCTILF